jgi:hypothetical protein
MAATPMDLRERFVLTLVRALVAMDNLSIGAMIYAAGAKLVYSRSPRSQPLTRRAASARSNEGTVALR